MDLEVEGRHALLFDDDAAASFVNSRPALVPWSGDPSLLIDRYDVRHLLDRIPARPPRRQINCRITEEHGGGVLQSELDLERYLDLPPPRADGSDGGDLAIESANESSDAGAYQAVSFSYDNTGCALDKKNSPGLDYSGFHPPFAVPESLQNNLPPTEKLHQIIARTATFVGQHGGQSEIVLRVKQGDNPIFGFLMPDHHLHAYFRYLVDHPQLLKADAICITTRNGKKSDDPEHEEHIMTGGALSLLGSVYGSGDDDDITQLDSKEMVHVELNVGGNPMVTHSSEHRDSSIASDDTKAMKRSATASAKQKAPTSKRNYSPDVTASNASCSKKTSDASAFDRTPTPLGMPDMKSSVFEPPSSLKEAIDKVVQFILRNGKEFEAILIEQDKTAGRFPFLLKSNLYHSYYLKILSEAREPQLQNKNHADQNHDATGRLGSKKRKHESPSNELTRASSVEKSEGSPCDMQKKEKFRMVIGGQKKDAQDHRSGLDRQLGVSVDEAAAIVMAATRGRSPCNLDQHPASFRRSGASTDEAAAIVQEATRGSSPAIALQNASGDEVGTVLTCGGSGLACSVGSFSSLGINLSSKSSLKGEVGISLPVDFSVSAKKLDTDGCGTDVLVAKAIAKSVALAASNEADSSEVSLTKEQKLKAERLKRAKMFAALIKSGKQGTTKQVHSACEPNLSPDASVACSIVGSVRSGPGSVLPSKESEDNPMPATIDISDSNKSLSKDPKYDYNREYSSRKHYRSKTSDNKDDLEDDRIHSKKHRSEHSSRHYYREEHRHSKSHSSSRDKDSRHHHKHRSYPEDEHKHRKVSRSRHRHGDGSSEDDDESKRSHRHGRKYHSHSERKQEIECEGKTTKALDQPENLSISSGHQRNVETASVSDTRTPSDATEVPSDLRAKIRAMLLETM